MRSQCTLCRHLGGATPIKTLQFQTISFQAFSSHQRRPEKGPTLPAPSATNPTRPQRSDVVQRIPVDSKTHNDLDLFQTFINPQKNYERYGGRNLLRYTYKQASQHFKALNTVFGKIDKAVLRDYMGQNRDHALFGKFKEIAELRRNYFRTVGSENFEERTDQSAARLRAEGVFAGLPRLLRNARRETRKLKQARKQNPYASRSGQLMGEETKRAMQNAPYLLKLRFSFSPAAQTKEQLRVLMRWLKLSETDRLSSRPFLTPSSREELRYALAEAHRVKLYYNRVFQVCKALCIIFACAFFAWKAGSGMIERWRASKRQAALEQISREDGSSSSQSKVTADVATKTYNE